MQLVQKHVHVGLDAPAIISGGTKIINIIHRKPNYLIPMII